MLNSQRLETPLKFVKPQELVAKKTFPALDLQYAAENEHKEGIINIKLAPT